MTYEVALHAPTRFAGAVVLSGTLFPSALAGAQAGVPFFIGHGTTDARIPFSAATSANAALGRLGTPIAFHAYPGMGHTNRRGRDARPVCMARRAGRVGSFASIDPRHPPPRSGGGCARLGAACSERR